MRYTTIIDISEYPSLYKNLNVRLVYLHLVLKCGYHDDDRDLYGVSIRRLAFEVGLTISAIRHALQQLETSGMIRRQGPMLQIRKWVYERPITSRPKSVEKARNQEEADDFERERQQRERDERAAAKKREKLRQQGKTTFMVYYESQLQKAETGDPEAADYCKKYLMTYQQHAQAVAEDARRAVAAAPAAAAAPPADSSK